MRNLYAALHKLCRIPQETAPTPPLESMRGATQFKTVILFVLTNMFNCGNDVNTSVRYVFQSLHVRMGH